MGAAEKRNALSAMVDLPSGALTVGQLAELMREVYREEEARKTAPANDPVVFMKPKDVAKLLNCSPRMVQLLAAKGELPHKKVGRELRFRPEDVDAYAAKKG